MPYAVIEYLDGTRKEYDFFYGGEAGAAQKAMELFVDEGYLAKRIYTINWDNDLDDILK